MKIITGGFGKNMGKLMKALGRYTRRRKMAVYHPRTANRPFRKKVKGQVKATIRKSKQKWASLSKAARTRRIYRAKRARRNIKMFEALYKTNPDVRKRTHRYLLASTAFGAGTAAAIAPRGRRRRAAIVGGALGPVSGGAIGGALVGSYYQVKGPPKKKKSRAS